MVAAHRRLFIFFVGHPPPLTHSTHPPVHPKPANALLLAIVSHLRSSGRKVSADRSEIPLAFSMLCTYMSVTLPSCLSLHLPLSLFLCLVLSRWSLSVCLPAIVKCSISS